MVRYLPCPACGDDRAFEQPPCGDGHGVDCPEWACVDCGAALLVGVPLPVGHEPGRDGVHPRPDAAAQSVSRRHAGREAGAPGAGPLPLRE